MCATAISFARIRRLYFGAADPKGGGVEHGPRIFSQPSCHHAPEVYGGIEETRAGGAAAGVFRRPPLRRAARAVPFGILAVGSSRRCADRHDAVALVELAQQVPVANDGA